MKNLTKASSRIRNGIFDLKINYPFSISYGKNYDYFKHQWWNQKPNGYYIRITFHQSNILLAFERRGFELKELNKTIKSILNEISNTFVRKNSEK